MKAREQSTLPFRLPWMFVHLRSAACVCVQAVSRVQSRMPLQSPYMRLSCSTHMVGSTQLERPVQRVGF